MSRVQKGGDLFTTYDQPYIMENGMNSGVLQYVYYFITLLIIVILVLVLVHYTIKPIFRINPGDSGIIGLPGTNDSKLFWENPDALTKISDKSTPLGSIVENWSMMLDIQVDNPTSNTDRPRILFTRGQDYVQPTRPFSASDTIMTINPRFNLCIYLDRLTNDLYVVVQTKNIQTDTPVLQVVSVPNIPVRASVRIGVFVGSKVLEVYVNGHLLRSKAFPESVLNIVGDLQPPLNNILSTTARVSNLRLWARPVSPAEFRSYGSSTAFSLKEITDTCLI
jgi:hypothetical protein